MKTKIIKLNPDFPDKASIKEAAKVLKKGGLVAFPTETVYGVGANFLDKKAIDKLYKIKKRPKNKPFTIHISKFEDLKDLKIKLSKAAERIIYKFWPGPLTIVAFNNKKEKIGIRMPKNKIALHLIDECCVPIVAPSANLSGKKPPISAKEVLSVMKNTLDVILDGGFTEIGIESTVLDVTTQPFTILREGAILEKDLLSEINVLFVCTGNSCRSVMAKGMLEKFLKEAGLSKKIQVDSAGTSTYRGVSAASNTITVMKEEGDYGVLISEMKIELDRIFANIRLKVGNCFDVSPFGALHEQYSTIKKPDVKEPQQEYKGIGAVVMGNPAITKMAKARLQPQNQS